MKSKVMQALGKGQDKAKARGRKESIRTQELELTQRSPLTPGTFHFISSSKPSHGELINFRDTFRGSASSKEGSQERRDQKTSINCTVFPH